MYNNNKNGSETCISKNDENIWVMVTHINCWYKCKLDSFYDN